MKQIGLVVAALLAGFVGGILGMLVIHAREQAHPEQVVRARRFELVNESGRAISYWGLAKSQSAVLAFGSNWPATSPEAHALLGHPAPNLENSTNQRFVIGVSGDEPYLHMSAADGRPRLFLGVNYYGKPTLAMDDETGTRVTLGSWYTDTGGDSNFWSLSFSPDRFDAYDTGATKVRCPSCPKSKP